jgi:hypothetical protein
MTDDWWLMTDDWWIELRFRCRPNGFEYQRQSLRDRTDWCAVHDMCCDVPVRFRHGYMTDNQYIEPYKSIHHVRTVKYLRFEIHWRATSRRSCDRKLVGLSNEIETMKAKIIDVVTLLKLILRSFILYLMMDQSSLFFPHAIYDRNRLCEKN